MIGILPGRLAGHCVDQVAQNAESLIQARVLAVGTEDDGTDNNLPRRLASLGYLSPRGSCAGLFDLHRASKANHQGDEPDTPFHHRLPLPKG